MTANVPVRRYVSPFACGTESYRPLIEVVDRTEPDHDEGPFYVLATEHERVVAELEKDSRDNYQEALATWAAQFERITAERDALAANNARLKADAERYRWLRERICYENHNGYTLMGLVSYLPEFDAAIDAAMKPSLPDTKERG